jgi:ribosomal protein L18
MMQVSGDEERPRLNIFRSNQHIYCQVRRNDPLSHQRGTAMPKWTGGTKAQCNARKCLALWPEMCPEQYTAVGSSW